MTDYFILNRHCGLLLAYKPYEQTDPEDPLDQWTLTESTQKAITVSSKEAFVYELGINELPLDNFEMLSPPYERDCVPSTMEVLRLHKTKTAACKISERLSIPDKFLYHAINKLKLVEKGAVEKVPGNRKLRVKRTYNPIDVEVLKQEYLQGLTTQEVIDKHGYSPYMIRKPKYTRASLGLPKVTSDRATKKQIIICLRLREQGKTLQTISDQVGLSVSTVRVIVKRIHPFFKKNPNFCYTRAKG